MLQAVHVQSPAGRAEAGMSAETACAAMSRLLAVAGHDLKQPLQVAVMAIERALQRSSDPEVAARLGIATGALHRLGHELDDLARSSQLRNGPVIQRGAVCLRHVFEELQAEWGGHARASGITLRFRPSTRMVDTDPTMLMAILRNLIGNAIKYSRCDGTVLIGCRRRGQHLAIAVYDQGEGIPSSRCGTIFDAFDRGGREHTQPGLGLGLAIVRQTALALDHRITVRSVEGTGSLFSVTVSLAERPDDRVRRRAVDAAEGRWTRLS